MRLQPMLSRERHNRNDNGKIQKILSEIQHDLNNSIEPITLSKLNSFERKLVHRHFDHNPDVVTKTYRNGEDFELKIYPVGNLRKFAQEKAEEAKQSRKKVALPHMCSYERFVIHDTLKEMDSIKAESFGEGEERHIEISPEAFGRGLKRIIKKIKLI